MPHHVSTVRQPMSMAARAAQFAPFAALDGHGAAIDETARVTGNALELTEDEQFELSGRITRAIGIKAPVLITYFSPDKRKSGGRYSRVKAIIKRVDECDRRLVLADGSLIPLQDVLSVYIIGDRSLGV